MGIYMDVHLVNLKNVIEGLVDKKAFLDKYNVVVSYVDLPIKVNGYCLLYRNIYNIRINYNISKKLQDRTIIHELAHVERNETGLNNLKYGFRCFIDGEVDEAEEYLKEILNNV